MLIKLPQCSIYSDLFTEIKDENMKHRRDFKLYQYIL